MSLHLDAIKLLVIFQAGLDGVGGSIMRTGDVVHDYGYARVADV